MTERREDKARQDCLITRLAPLEDASFSLLSLELFPYLHRLPLCHVMWPDY